MRALHEGRVGTVLGHQSMGGGEDELVASEANPEKARVVHGAWWEGDRFLGSLLWDGHHREEVDPRSMEALPLGEPIASQAMTYPRKLKGPSILRLRAQPYHARGLA